MDNYIDIKLSENNEGIYDINIAENGDFELEDSFDTSIILSLGTDARASESEMPIPELRRGWWGNLYNSTKEHETGSKLWLLSQSRMIQDTLISANDYAKKCLDWLQNDNHLKNINVSGNLTENGIKLNIKQIRKDDRIKNLFYDLWERSQFK